jgi:hypothetical protein
VWSLVSGAGDFGVDQYLAPGLPETAKFRVSVTDGTVTIKKCRECYTIYQPDGVTAVKYVNWDINQPDEASVSMKAGTYYLMAMSAGSLSGTSYNSGTAAGQAVLDVSYSDTLFDLKYNLNLTVTAKSPAMAADIR